MAYKKALLGMSDKSTAYYQSLIDQHRPEIDYHVMETDFESINQHLPNNFSALETMLLPYFREMKQMNIHKVLIPNCTIHQAIDLFDLEATFSIEICHPFQLSIEYLKQHNIKEVVILATKHTMTNPYWINKIQEEGICVLPLDDPLLLSIDSLRKAVFYQEKMDYQAKWNDILALIPAGIHPLIACTELSMINRSDRCIDAANLQVDSFT